jgi:hypothetical protein
MIRTMCTLETEEHRLPKHWTDSNSDIQKQKWLTPSAVHCQFVLQQKRQPGERFCGTYSLGYV